MLRLSKLAAGLAGLSFVAVAAAAAPVLADPVNGSGKAVVPAVYDIVGVGDASSQYLFDQLSVDYNAAHKTHNAKNPYIYSWDAYDRATGKTGDADWITERKGCPSQPRPDGSYDGIAALQLYNFVDGHLCISFARSAGVTPSLAGDVSVTLARDAVTYAFRDKAAGGSNAPANLTRADLVKIYTCDVRNWNQVGGKNGTIRPFLPEGESYRSAFLQAIGVTVAGSCVASSVLPDEGTARILDNPDVIVPYSVADYIAQAYHSARCGSKPAGAQNRFGCAQNGVLSLGDIDGTKPTVGTGVHTTINIRFAAAFLFLIYDVVQSTDTPTPAMPAIMERFFGTKPKGWFCSSATAVKDIESYGFLADDPLHPSISYCGQIVG